MKPLPRVEAVWKANARNRVSERYWLACEARLSQKSSLTLSLARNRGTLPKMSHVLGTDRQ